MVSNDIFFFPFNTLDMYCWVQPIFPASIFCVRPSSPSRAPHLPLSPVLPPNVGSDNWWLLFNPIFFVRFLLIDRRLQVFFICKNGWPFFDRLIKKILFIFAHETETICVSGV